MVLATKQQQQSITLKNIQAEIKSAKNKIKQQLIVDINVQFINPKHISLYTLLSSKSTIQKLGFPTYKHSQRHQLNFVHKNIELKLHKNT